MMEHDYVRVMPARIGLGVFATETIPADKCVGIVCGEVFEDHESDYCMDLDDGTVLEPFAPFRYINHSCNPNCEIVVWDRPGHPNTLWIESSRMIEVGEELTLDYGWPAAGAIRCGCLSDNCRGWIVDETELGLLQSPAPHEPDPDTPIGFSAG
ncbi:MAG: SET domain-containing protein-lysine N-methyltransferase [Pirellulaceae bacterium]|jgi:hypothetical protein|nr:SET domain-containing protein-lysine N-methyltransferase [Pirellulaceae bacterium]MDP7019553.1 SET domain-containing protein-lysine N-methyltransferase [Pirellulaceae bacterium]